MSFQRRTSPLAVQLRAACLARGPIFHAVCEFYKYEPKPFVNARDHMMDDGVHAIDTLRWLCSGEVVGVEATARRMGTPDLNYFTVLLHFDNGATGVWMSNWNSGRRIFRVAMHAPGICAESELEQHGTLYAGGDTQGVHYTARDVAGSDELHIVAGFQAKNRQFIDAVQTRTPPASSFADALKTMEVAETVLAQARLRGL